MASAPDDVEMGAHLLDDAESRALFDLQAQRLLGISGDEFLRRYDAGEYDRPDDDRQLRAVMKLAMLTTFVR